MPATSGSGSVRGLLRVGLSFAVLFAVVGLLVFLPAGRLDWPAAWAWLGTVATGLVLIRRFVVRAHPDLPARRRKAGAGTPLWDRAVLGVFQVAFVAVAVLAGLDARHGWSALPAAVAVTGLALIAAGLGLFGWAMVHNRFFESTVRIQDDVGHAVAASGPYRVVRHPGYAGLVPIMLGTPLALGSLWALVPAAAGCAALVVRTALEDRYLRQRLDGYREYAAGVPRRLIPGLWLFSILALSAACGDGAADSPTAPGPVRYLEPLFDEVLVDEGIAYGRARRFGELFPTMLFLDLYTPAGDEAVARPAIVWIHGGGFIAGTRTSGGIPTLARAFARRGYVNASIDYRLRTGVTFTLDPIGTMRDAVHDARAAVRWLRAHAAELGIDATRIGIAGSSAGAITGLLAAYDDFLGPGRSGSPGYPSDIRVIVDFWGSLPGPLDLLMDADEPPLLIFHGTEDEIVPYAEALELVERAGEIGLPHTFVPLEARGHAPWDDFELYEAEMSAFLFDHLVSDQARPR